MLGQWENITPYIIYKTLKSAATFCDIDLGFTAKDILDCSLCTTGEIDLIYDSIYAKIVKLISHSDRNEIL